MLTMTFVPDATDYFFAVHVDAPYDRVAHFLTRDIQNNFAYAKRLAGVLRDIQAGRHAPLDGDTGNVWMMEIDAKTAVLTNEFATPIQRVELPTEWLIDALERWHDFLVSSRFAL